MMSIGGTTYGAVNNNILMSDTDIPNALYLQSVSTNNLVVSNNIYNGINSGLPSSIKLSNNLDLTGHRVVS